MKLTFKDGGAFDFHSTFEQIKEQVSHAAEIAIESGRANRNTNGPIDVDLEQLPAYEESGNGGHTQQSPPTLVQTSAPEIQRPTPISPDGITHSPPYRSEPSERAPKPAPTISEPFPPPNESPPRYEEVQSSSVANNLERRLRDQQ